MMIIQPDNQNWNTEIEPLPGAHALQTREWAQVKSRLDWRPFYAVWKSTDGTLSAAALILERTLRFKGFSAPLRVQYVPRGPLLDWGNRELRRTVVQDLQLFARKRGAIFIKIDPELVMGTGVPGEPGAEESPTGAGTQSLLRDSGWVFSSDQIQFRNTIQIDLTGSEDQILARMKQKSRYNIRLAQRKGVTVRSGTEADFPFLYKMYAETALRDGFVIRGQDYYTHVWQTYFRAGMAEPLIAEVEGEPPVAAIIVFRFAQKAWYLYGMSRNAHREKMPNALLQWEAMRRSKQAGCVMYDLWGAPDRFDETDSMWGVYRFKEGLGGQVIRTIGAWDYAPHKLFYTLYTRTLPRILDGMRRRGVARTRKEMSGL